MIWKDSNELELFLSSVAETTAWCARRLRVEDPAGSLRTKSLMPSLVNLEEENQCSWNYQISDPILEVNELARRRGSHPDNQNVSDEIVDLSAGGRLLLFYPLETLCDGAAFQSSKGFFDYWNIPPWDTWIQYTHFSDERQVLISWVPSQFLELASSGVCANPEQCLRWLDVPGF